MTISESIERALRTSLTRRSITISQMGRRLGASKQSARARLTTAGNAAERLAEICEAAGSNVGEIWDLAQQIRAEETAAPAEAGAQ